MADLENQQRKAIRMSKELGLKLKERFPEIAYAYRKGSTLREIVDEYGIAQQYNIPLRVAIGAVSLAIRGHAGGFGIPPYRGLINDESELEALCNEHRNKPLRSNHPDDLSKYGRKGGKISGNQNKGSGKIICGMTGKELREAGVKSAISRGFVPWIRRIKAGRYYIPSEIYYTYQLSQDPEYWSGTKTNNQMIANEINQIYHNGVPVRSGESVKVALQRYLMKR